MIEKTWLVQALSIGISYNDFWHMTPHTIAIQIDAHKKKIEEKNYFMYIQGRYFADAIMATIGNSFRGKGQKPYEYPKEPYELTKRELTQSEKI